MTFDEALARIAELEKENRDLLADLRNRAIMNPVLADLQVACPAYEGVTRTRE